MSTIKRSPKIQNTESKKQPTPKPPNPALREQQHLLNETKLSIFQLSPVSAGKDTGSTLAQIPGIIQCCSSHMDPTTAKKAAVVWLYHMLALGSNQLEEINMKMTFETDVT